MGKQANAAQKNYDHIAEQTKQANIERDSLATTNEQAKKEIEELKPKVKAAWTVHARWEKALHPPKTTTKKHHEHKRDGHKSEHRERKHHDHKQHDHENRDHEPEDHDHKSRHDQQVNYGSNDA